MNTAARAKTRKKRAAPDPWRALPRLAELFERTAPELLFKGSKVAELEELPLTEAQLLEQTASVLNVSLAQLVRTGATPRVRYCDPAPGSLALPMPASRPRSTLWL
jgi:predicted RNA-binding Zn ribbon-like protein